MQPPPTPRIPPCRKVAVPCAAATYVLYRPTFPKSQIVACSGRQRLTMFTIAWDAILADGAKCGRVTGVLAPYRLTPPDLTPRTRRATDAAPPQTWTFDRRTDNAEWRCPSCDPEAWDREVAPFDVPRPGAHSETWAPAFDALGPHEGRGVASPVTPPGPPPDWEQPIGESIGAPAWPGSGRADAPTNLTSMGPNPTPRTQHG